MKLTTVIPGVVTRVGSGLTDAGMKLLRENNQHRDAVVWAARDAFREILPNYFPMLIHERHGKCAHFGDKTPESRSPRIITLHLVAAGGYTKRDEKGNLTTMLTPEAKLFFKNSRGTTTVIPISLADNTARFEDPEHLKPFNKNDKPGELRPLGSLYAHFFGCGQIGEGREGTIDFRIQTPFVKQSETRISPMKRVAPGTATLSPVVMACRTAEALKEVFEAFHRNPNWNGE